MRESKHAEVAETTEARSPQETPGWRAPRALDLHLPAARGRFQQPLAGDARGGGKGCLQRVEFPREKQRIDSANSEAEDALLGDWGPWRAKGSRGREGPRGAGEGCGERGSGTPSGRGGEARGDGRQELRVCGRSCCHSPGVPGAVPRPRSSPRRVIPVPTAHRVVGERQVSSGCADGWTGRDQRAKAGPMGERGTKRDRRFPPGMSKGWIFLFV